jgi:radical SAM PhpK family P-methyltransferase
MSYYDCLLIGHNELDFPEYIERQKVNEGMAFELSYSYIQDDGIPINLQDIYNKYAKQIGINKYGPLDSSNLLNTAVAYLGSYLHRNGLSFDYINSFHRDKDLLEKKLVENDYLTVAITTTFHFVSYPVQQIINFIRKINEKVKIIVGGPYIQGNIQFGNGNIHFLHRSLKADIYIVSSQGEKAIVNTIAALKNNESLDGIDNVVFVDNKKLQINDYVIENNLLKDNMVKWSLFEKDIKYYASVRTAISCPMTCAFCTYPAWAGKYNYATVDGIKYELDQLQNTGVVKTVFFMDDTLNMPLKRFKEILRMMISQKYDFSWHSYIRCQFLDEEALELMEKSKCEGVMLGIESANNSILENLNKKATVDQYYSAMDLLSRYDINTMTYILVGFPGETEETFEETMTFLKETKPDFFRPFVWFASPVTPIMKRAKEFGIEGDSYYWKHNTMDVNKANELYHRLFCEIKDSIWIPQYNSDYTGIAHLRARGMSIDEIKRLIRLYNNEILRQKMSGSDRVSNNFIANAKSILATTELRYASN